MCLCVSPIGMSPFGPKHAPARVDRLGSRREDGSARPCVNRPKNLACGCIERRGSSRAGHDDHAILLGIQCHCCVQPRHQSRPVLELQAGWHRFRGRSVARSNRTVRDRSRKGGLARDVVGPERDQLGHIEVRSASSRQRRVSRSTSGMDGSNGVHPGRRRSASARSGPPSRPTARADSAVHRHNIVKGHGIDADQPRATGRLRVINQLPAHVPREFLEEMPATLPHASLQSAPMILIRVAWTRDVSWINDLQGSERSIRCRDRPQLVIHVGHLLERERRLAGGLALVAFRDDGSQAS